ncbi:MAG: GntR family transcriptional regulator [Rhodomicrobium sp.]
MNPSQAERLRSLIENEISSFRFKPGDRLDETKLAEKYGTSRTPVREALRQLAADGLIEIRPHKGAVVAKLGMRDLVEMLEVIAELEGACGRMAARACLYEDIERIGASLEACQDYAATEAVAAYHEANEAFHDAIYQASRNSYLIKLTRSARNRLVPYIRLHLNDTERLRTSIREHELIVRAIEEGQAEEADRLLQMHMLNTRGALRALILSASDWNGSLDNRPFRFKNHHAR